MSEEIETIKCQKCGTENSSSDKFCKECGTLLKITYWESLKNIFSNTWFKNFSILMLIIVFLPLSLFRLNFGNVIEVLYSIVLIFAFIAFFIIGLKDKLKLNLVKKYININTAILVILGLLTVKLWLATSSIPTTANIFGLLITGINIDNFDDTSLDIGLSACGIYILVLFVVFLVLLHYYKKTAKNQEQQLQDFYNKTVIYSYTIFLLNFVFIIVGALFNIVLLLTIQQFGIANVLVRISVGLVGIMSMFIVPILIFISTNVLLINKKECLINE